MAINGHVYNMFHSTEHNKMAIVITHEIIHFYSTAMRETKQRCSLLSSNLEGALYKSS